MSDPVKIGPFLGMDNKLPTSKLRVPPSPGQQGGNYVRDALNVDLTSAGTLQRRGGSTLIASSVRASSLWSSGDISDPGYYVDNGVIKQYDGTTFTTITTICSPSATASFTRTPLGVAWTDGLNLSLISNAVSHSLVIPVPNPSPIVTSVAGGGLAAGVYTVAFASLDANSRRSAVTGFQTLTVAAGTSLSISTVAQPNNVAVFVSAAGGSVLYQETVLAAGTISATIPLIYSNGVSVGATLEAPMPAGAQVRYYRGRLLVVSGSVVYYSHAYNYGVYNPASNFILLDAPVTLCEPTQDGVFLATANDTWFLDGHDVASAELKPLAPYGAIPNTAAAEPNTLNLWWFTPRGAVRTTDQNTLEMKQDDHLVFSAASTGAALFREENGLTQVISALSNAAPTGAASATSYMTATTVN